MKDNHHRFWPNVDDYHNQVFSVFADKKAENPIFDYLKKKPKKFTIKRVIAVDYSESLLKEAKNKYINLDNIEYKELNFKNLSSLYDSVDIAVSINSLLPETINDVETIIQEFYKIIKTGGEFVGILPSADTVIHLALLKHEELLDNNIPEKQATKEIEELFTKERQFSILGFQRDTQKDPRQKYFYPFEIVCGFRKAGFKSIKLKKVYYSWDYCKNHHYGYFPEKERIWD